MNPTKLASGDNSMPVSPKNDDEKLREIDETKNDNDTVNFDAIKMDGEHKPTLSEITTQMINDNEIKLKERIAQCRNIIESLKFELNAEKSKLEKDSKTPKSLTEAETGRAISSSCHFVSSSHMLEDLPYASSIYSASVDIKLNCDENLMEYEKQLQKYQNTLNMAQTEKKNAIRKQMLAKAYRLKLLEVENQCNIELLRVKQSLQCLEPLQAIANNWKINKDVYDCNHFDLIPRYPELGPNSRSDINSHKGEIDFEGTIEKSDIITIEDSVSSDIKKIL